MIYANGDKYVGEWKDGFYSGLGLMTYVTGDSYEGQFRQGLYYNEGIYYTYYLLVTILYMISTLTFSYTRMYMYMITVAIYNRCI